MRFFVLLLLLLASSGCLESDNPISDQSSVFRDTGDQPAKANDDNPTAVALFASKMNVVYLGIDNPMSVKTYDIDPSKVKVAASRGQVSGNSEHFVYKVSGTVGSVKFTVSGPDGVLEEFEFRVKRIPDPVAKMGGKFDGDVSSGELKAQRGIYAAIFGFDFQATCTVIGFDISRIPENEGKKTFKNEGGNFERDALALIGMCLPGDFYFLTRIRVKCPGDEVMRSLPPLAFRVV